MQTQKQMDFKITPLVKKEIAKIVVKQIKEFNIKNDDLSDVKDIVKFLAGSQKESEKRFVKIEISLKELAEAQKRTETRLDSLIVRVEELAEAQKRTETRLEELIGEHEKTRKLIGDISHTVGYGLEDKYYSKLLCVLKQDFGVEISGYLERKYITYPNGRDDEINIYGEGILDNKKIYIIGESKAQIGKNDIRDFDKKIKRLEQHLQADIIPILLCYMVHPSVEEFLKTCIPNAKIYRSFELDRRS